MKKFDFCTCSSCSKGHRVGCCATSPEVIFYFNKFMKGGCGLLQFTETLCEVENVELHIIIRKTKNNIFYTLRVEAHRSLLTG